MVATISSIASAVLHSQALSEIPGVVHGITGRHVGFGLADGNIGYSAPRDRLDAWSMRQAWCEAIGVDPARLVTLSQVHGSCVIRVGRRDAGRGAQPGSTAVARGDALITDQPGVVLLTLHADCTPILLADPDRPAVAAVHAGWRGTVADIPGATVRAMVDAFGSAPERLRVYVGPGIGPCCYVVGDDVIQAWQRRAGADAYRAIASGEGSAIFDVPAAIQLLLARAGVLPEHIELSGTCTQCHGDVWFSHRGQGAATGRFGAIIALTGDEPGHDIDVAPVAD